ncbi:alpha/beta fold hydrolase [Xenorhabdus griffiniae]|uniref:thioesterase II family protein n=1 Tax=Xenorhabdus TaxID=626 RepID=UPI0030CE413B
MNNQRLQLLMFHHAGGNSSIFSDFAKRCFDDFNVIQLEMPGRGRRRHEPLMYCVDHVIKDFASQVPPQGDIVLFGYSLGAYIAYVMASYCRKLSPKRKIILVVISNEPIHCRRKFSLGAGEFTHQQLLKFTTKLGQLPKWLREESTMLQSFLNVLEADLCVANSISAELSSPLNDIPILVVYGNNDPLLPTPPLRWRECTQKTFNIIEVSGDHFILSEQETQIYKIMKDFLNKVAFDRQPSRKNDSDQK